MRGVFRERQAATLGELLGQVDAAVGELRVVKKFACRSCAPVAANGQSRARLRPGGGPCTAHARRAKMRCEGRTSLPLPPSETTRPPRQHTRTLRQTPSRWYEHAVCPRCAAIAVAARPPNYSLPRTCRAVKISKRIQLADHACCIFRSATLPTTSSPLRALALAALTSASPSRTPGRPPRPSTAGSLSAPSSTSTTSRRSRRPSP